MNSKYKYGIDKDKYNKLVDSLNYQSGYGLSEELGEIAYYISHTNGISLLQAFSFVWEFSYAFALENDKTIELHKYLCNDKILKKYFVEKKTVMQIIMEEKIE